MEQIRESINRPTHMRTTIFDKGAEAIKRESIVFSTNGTGTIGYPRAEI